VFFILVKTAYSPPSSRCRRSYTESPHDHAATAFQKLPLRISHLCPPPLKRSAVSSDGNGDTGCQRPSILAPRALRSPPHLLQVRATLYGLFFFLSSAKRYLGFFQSLDLRGHQCRSCPCSSSWPRQQGVSLCRKLVCSAPCYGIFFFLDSVYRYLGFPNLPSICRHGCLLRRRSSP
jgi:hypothetical protein